MSAKKDYPSVKSRKSQQGFSLLEALVTIVVLAVGLLGLAFLQAQGLQLNTSAYSRTQASILASDIIDRMRLNPTNVASYNTELNTPNPADCVFTTAQDAQNDLDCWTQRLQTTLPSGDGDVIVAGGVVTVTVSWQERPSGRQRDDFDPTDPDNEDLIQELRTQEFEMTVNII